MKYSSRGRSILLGNSRRWARAGPSTSAEATRATKKATLEGRADGTSGNVGAFRWFRFQMPMQPQPGGGAPARQRAILFEIQTRIPAQGFQRRKLAISLRPVAWLF